MFAGSTGRHPDMSDDKPKPKEEKSPWPRRMAIGFGVVLALGLVVLLVANVVIKRVVVGKIEEGLAKEGLAADVGEFNFSVLRKEIEVNNFSATPTTSKALDRLGNVKLQHGRVKLTMERKSYIEELHLEGLTSKLGSVEKADIVADKSILLEGLKLNYPAKLGGEPFMEFSQIKLVYAKPSGEGNSHFKEVHVDLSALTIVRGPDGKWMSDQTDEATKRVSGMKEVSAVDHLTIKIGEIRFKDLSTGEPAKVIEVNKEIVVNDPQNPRAYPMIILPKLLWITRVAKKEFGIE